MAEIFFLFDIFIYSKVFNIFMEQKPKITVSRKLKGKLDNLVEKKADTYEDIIWRLLKK